MQFKNRSALLLLAAATTLLVLLETHEKVFDVTVALTVASLKKGVSVFFLTISVRNTAALALGFQFALAFSQPAARCKTPFLLFKTRRRSPPFEQQRSTKHAAEANTRQSHRRRSTIQSQ